MTSVLETIPKLAAVPGATSADANRLNITWRALVGETRAPGVTVLPEADIRLRVHTHSSIESVALLGPCPEEVCLVVEATILRCFFNLPSRTGNASDRNT